MLMLILREFRISVNFFGISSEFLREYKGENERGNDRIDAKDFGFLHYSASDSILSIF